MSVLLRIMLFLCSVFTFSYVVRKIRKSQMQVGDTIFWILMSAVILLLSIFPEIAMVLSEFLSIESPVNFVFLSIIFLLLFRVFLLSIRVSKLEYNLKRLVEEIGVRENFSQRDDVENGE